MLKTDYTVHQAVLYQLLVELKELQELQQFVLSNNHQLETPQRRGMRPHKYPLYSINIHVRQYHPVESVW